MYLLHQHTHSLAVVLCILHLYMPAADRYGLVISYSATSSETQIHNNESRSAATNGKTRCVNIDIPLYCR